MTFCNTLLNWTLLCLKYLHLKGALQGQKILQYFFLYSTFCSMFPLFMKWIINALINVHLYIPVQKLWFCDYSNKMIFLVKVFSNKLFGYVNMLAFKSIFNQKKFLLLDVRRWCCDPLIFFSWQKKLNSFIIND